MTTRGVRVNTAGAALGSAALAEAILGFEFVLGGLNKYLAKNFAANFGGFVDASVSTQGRVLTPVVQAVIIPNSAVFAELARLTELAGGLTLAVAACVSVWRYAAGRSGGVFEMWISALASIAALALGGLSLTIYLLKGGPLPGLDPKLALAPPVQVELVNVGLAAAVAWFGISRFLELRGTTTTFDLKWHPRWLAGVLMIVATTVSLAACGGSAAAGPPAGSIRVTMTDYRFNPSALDVTSASATFYLVNGGGQSHDIVIADSGGKVIARSDLVSPGDAASFTISNLQPGDYTIYCDVPGHRESGMVGTLKVRGTAG